MFIEMVVEWLTRYLIKELEMLLVAIYMNYPAATSTKHMVVSLPLSAETIFLNMITLKNMRPQTH